jgi:hypothetical protein
MASWSTKRKYSYFFSFIVFVVVVIAAPIYFIFHKTPTCFDGIKNGSEKDIDCGGSCVRLCPVDFFTPHILWSYSMIVAPGIYNSMTYAENPNQTVEARSAPYTFTLYDAKGAVIAERKGKAFVPAGSKFAVFTGGINTGGKTPVKTTFEFDGSFDWARGVKISGLRVLDINLEQENAPAATAKIINDGDKPVSSLDAFIVLYDENNNRLAFSKTIIDKINPRETQNLYFTWPSAFSRKAIRTEVLFSPN